MMKLTRLDRAKANHFDNLLDALEHSKVCPGAIWCDGCINANLVLTLARLTRKAEQEQEPVTAS